MAQVKVGTDKMPITEKIQFARQIVIDMTGNVNFTTPSPALATISTAATALESAYNAAQTARQTAKALTTTQDAKSAALDFILTQEATYVQNASNGDKAKIESSGFATRNPSSPIGELPQPAGLQAEQGGNAGLVDLTWIPVHGSKSYLIEKAPDSAEPLVYVQGAVATKAKVSVNSMASGSRYWFRVAAVNAAGQSAWSNPVPKIVP